MFPQFSLTLTQIRIRPDSLSDSLAFSATFPDLDNDIFLALLEVEKNLHWLLFFSHLEIYFPRLFSESWQPWHWITNWGQVTHIYIYIYIHMYIYIYILIQLMACRAFGAKLLSDPIHTYWWLDYKKHSRKFEIEYKCFLSRDTIWKCCLQDGSHFIPVLM